MMMRNKFWKIGTVLGLCGLFLIMGFMPPGNSGTVQRNAGKETLGKTNGQLPVIMLTGYWDPTGQMIASFSDDPTLNPGGWKGGNWEDEGYDIYSFFPTPGTYTGTLEVDYQDTWEDFWEITSLVHPVAIISFGSGAGPWEIEYNARNLEYWINDETPPYQPTPSPPDDTAPAGFIRHSTLPCQAIADAVNSQIASTAWVDWDGFAGSYLCEYIAYLGMWYQALHGGTSDPHPCQVAGFIHVNSGLPLDEAIVATSTTIRETITYLQETNNPPLTPVITGPTSGEIGTEYDYTIQARDPEGDNIYYWVSWGEGCTVTEWMGPYASNESITLQYTWEQQGAYTITAIAKDIHDEESNPGRLDISMPKTGMLRHLIHVLEQLRVWLDNQDIWIPFLHRFLS